MDATDCVNCQLFVGPVDGAALFTRVRGCQVAVACQQFRARACTDTEFGLYCATVPSVADCSGLRVGCWVGAYPGLTTHFAAASLDPSANAWTRVEDATPVPDGGDGFPAPPFPPRPQAPPFEVVGEAHHYREVPLAGRPPPDKPVPGPTGVTYTPSETALASVASGGVEEVVAAAAEAAADAAAAAVPPPPPAAAAVAVDTPTMHPPIDAVDAAFADANGDAADAAPAPPHVAPLPTDAAETEGRAAAAATAAAHLRDFYAAREARVASAAASAKAAAPPAPRAPAPAAATTTAGSGDWGRVLDLIDLDALRPGGGELSRFKAAMLTAKARGLPLSRGGRKAE